MCYLGRFPGVLDTALGRQVPKSWLSCMVIVHLAGPSCCFLIASGKSGAYRMASWCFPRTLLLFRIRAVEGMMEEEDLFPPPLLSKGESMCVYVCVPRSMRYELSSTYRGSSGRWVLFPCHWHEKWRWKDLWDVSKVSRIISRKQSRDVFLGLFNALELMPLTTMLLLWVRKSILRVE